MRDVRQREAGFGDRAQCGGETQAGDGRPPVKLPQFQAVNTVLSIQKAAMAGTCHAIKFAKHAHRYFAEVASRLKRRFERRRLGYAGRAAAVDATSAGANCARYSAGVNAVWRLNSRVKWAWSANPQA